MSQKLTLQASTGFSELRALTGVRGVAAFYVVLVHLRPADQDVPASLWKTFVGKGYLSVDLFFVLSGFVMALNYAPRFTNKLRGKEVYTFLARRFARIYPLYLVTLVAATYVNVKRHQTTPGTVLANLLMIQYWGFWKALNGPSWSISTEWASYLMFPLLTFGLAFRVFRPVWLIICIAGLVNYCQHSAFGFPFGPSELIRCITDFSFGILLCMARSTPPAQRIMRSSWMVYVPIAVLLAELMFFHTSGLGGVLAVAMFSLLTLTLSGTGNWVSWILGTAPFEYLGQISYSVYLLHMMVFAWFNTHVQNLAHSHAIRVNYSVREFLGIASIVLISTGSYHLIEVPSRKLLRRVMEPQKARPEMVQAV